MVDDDDLFSWYFTLRGAPDSDYEGGLYHGKIILPNNYPLSAPDLIFITVSNMFLPPFVNEGILFSIILDSF